MDKINLCWIHCKYNQWKKGFILERNNDKTLLIKDEFGQKFKVNQNDIFFRNDENLLCKDLINLVHLNEPSILNTIFNRYQNDKIYTFNNNILLAVNPYKNINLYGEQFIQIYNSDLDDIEPHPYIIANNALKSLQNENLNQSILVSGESGAGKTQTTKYLMNFISKISNSKFQLIKDMILASNPILEIFGNAKTTQNNNSSRFGKFIKLLFNKNNELKGAKIETYLLEKVRITNSKKNEQNFHIFNLLLQDRANLSQFNHSIFIENIDYNYVNKNIKCNEQLSFNLLDKSFHLLQFTKSDKIEIYKIVSFIINLGNIESILDLTYENKFIQNCCGLLEFNQNEFISYLKFKFLTVNNETIQIENCEKDLLILRDSTAQELYKLLFNFLVSKINKVISSESSHFIGILDIFGFEIFKSNYFEQLCINYTNEKLQYLFNNYIFKLEQQEYLKENIKWNHINYPDNTKILNTIDNRQNSIFSFLNEQSILKNGNDQNVYSIIYNNLKDNKNIKFRHSFKVKKQFSIQHYAGDVCYTVKNFIQKNKYELNPEFIKMFSKNQFIQDNFNLGHKIQSKTKSKSKSKTKTKTKTKTILQNFKKQLTELASIVSKTNQHYIRCIKPNDVDKSDQFIHKRVYEQLKYCGVLESIKIARAGYPIRINYNDFYYKFFSYIYFNKIDMNTNSFTNLYDNLKDTLKKKMDIQFGKTKIFLKKYLYQIIVDKNINIQTNKALQIQKCVRMHCKYSKYTFFKKNICILQLKYKSYFAKKIESIKIITKHISGYIQQKIFNKIKQNIVKIQSIWRLFVERKKYVFVRHIVKIQSIYRSYHQQNMFRKKIIMIRSINKIMNQFRRFKYRQSILKHLREFVGSQNKIKLLKLELEKQKQKEDIIFKEYEEKQRKREQDFLRLQSQNQYSQINNEEVKKLKQVNEKKDKEIELLRKEKEIQEKEKNNQINQLKKEKEEHLKQKEKLMVLLEKKKTELSNILTMKKQQLVREQEIIAKFNEEKNALKQQKDDLRLSYQIEYQKLLQKIEDEQKSKIKIQSFTNNFKESQQKKDLIISKKLQDMYLNLEKAKEEVKFYKNIIGKNMSKFDKNLPNKEDKCSVM